jgi:hypothetical protein
MTRKDYETIAAALRAAPLGSASREVVVAYLSAALAADNVKFDAARFRAACYPK